MDDSFQLFYCAKPSYTKSIATLSLSPETTKSIVTLSDLLRDTSKSPTKSIATLSVSSESTKSMDTLSGLERVEYLLNKTFRPE
ncbi:hypothetical protein BHYA_0099g00230 [Botrytis hyacinthi]|uniref:Uncharacterized protein n=1 Tax=Botrytis hyacinthi TaxID=278943 RepID=A0A4Z1GK94_9HELO|nr:hypothetical protein BHYA_0099g00230 [Botrytis hyacinthi]